MLAITQIQQTDFSEMRIRKLNNHPDDQSLCLEVSSSVALGCVLSCVLLLLPDPYF